MLSRVADSIYWMSRYSERAENVARFIEVNLYLSLDLGSELGNQWAPLIFTTGDQELFVDRYGEPDEKKVIEFLSFDEQNPNSILSCLRSARENARTVREMISSSMWEELNKFYLMVRAAAASRTAIESPLDFFTQVKLNSHLLQGVRDATMSRGEAWHFARLARLLERADKTSRILDVKYYLLLPSAAEIGTPVDTIQWAALLKSASALEMYRKSHGRITPANVADFLILDREFPRAMRFCLINAEDSLLAITGSTPGTFRNAAEQKLGRLRSELDYADINEIIEGGLHEFIDRFQTKINAVGEAVAETFLTPRPVSSLTNGQFSGGNNMSQTQTQHAR
ncbi:MAG: alpha-E domain-containing protein [Planctomycetota bacterium]|nr:alpha-E domain-containing protein [Planctomycetota bacterium]